MVGLASLRTFSFVSARPQRHHDLESSRIPACEVLYVNRQTLHGKPTGCCRSSVHTEVFSDLGFKLSAAAEALTSVRDDVCTMAERREFMMTAPVGTEQWVATERDSISISYSDHALKEQPRLGAHSTRSADRTQRSCGGTRGVPSILKTER